MEEPKQLSVSELRKKFESKPSTSSTPSTTKLVQSTTTQPPRQAFPGNSQPNGTNDDNKPAASEPDTTNLSVKERMKMFDKSKNQQETQPAPIQPKKTQVPPQATVNSENIETTNVSAEPEKEIVSEPEPVQEPIQQEEARQEPEQIEEIQQEEIPQEPIQQEPEQTQEIQHEEIAQEPVQQEGVHQEPEQAEEIQQEEIAPQVVQEEEIVPEVQEEKVQEVVEEVQEPIQQPEVVQVQEKQEEQVPVAIVEKEETKEPETHNPVLNRNAGFASEMNAMLAKKGLRSNEDSPIKPEQSKSQGLSHEDAYTEALLTRPTSDPRKKKAKLVFVDDEDF